MVGGWSVSFVYFFCLLEATQSIYCIRLKKYPVKNISVSNFFTNGIFKYNHRRFDAKV
jgi:hypothetical protein